MNKYDIFAADQRLLILKSLEDAGYTANEVILRSCLDGYGHTIGQDVLRSHLLWLEEQGLLVNNTVGNYFVANITEKGLDVAQGRQSVHGVRRPRPIY